MPKADITRITPRNLPPRLQSADGGKISRVLAILDAIENLDSRNAAPSTLRALCELGREAISGVAAVKAGPEVSQYRPPAQQVASAKPIVGRRRGRKPKGWSALAESASGDVLLASAEN